MYGTDMCAQLQVPVRFGQDSGGRRYCKDCTGDLLRQLQERKEGSYMNAAVSDRSPSDLCSVDCKATECMYNEDCQCHAGKISVEGSDACHCEGTECATFQCR